MGLISRCINIILKIVNMFNIFIFHRFINSKASNIYEEIMLKWEVNNYIKF